MTNTQPSATAETPAAPKDFIRDIIDEDVRSGKNEGAVVTRFPPEPNGYLHIGHAKSICLNFGIAGEYAGARCHLRFDDTNPAREDVEYVNSIQEDVRWLGFDWGANLFYASDYFEKIYGYAVELIDRRSFPSGQRTQPLFRQSRRPFLSGYLCPLRIG